MGGRGAGSSLRTVRIGGGSVGGGQFSKGLGFQNYDSLKDALGPKGRPFSIEDSAEGANPHYDHSLTYKEFNLNCQRCAVAYEGRRRGYDVTAQPTYEGDTLPISFDVGDKRFGHWQGAFQNMKSENVSSNSPQIARRKLEKKMSAYGDGTRGIVSVVWKDGSGGHVFNVEQVKGKTLYIDAQVGAKYEATNLYRNIQTDKVFFFRTDNLRFSDRAKKSITKDKW